MQLNQQLRLLLPLLLSAILLAACATAPAPGAGAPTSTRAPASTPTPAPTPSPTPTPIPTPTPLPREPPGWKWFTVQTDNPTLIWHIAAPIQAQVFVSDDGDIQIWIPGRSFGYHALITADPGVCWNTAPPPDETMIIAGSPALVSRGFVRYTQKGFLCASFPIDGNPWYLFYRGIESWEWEQAYAFAALLWVEHP